MSHRGLFAALIVTALGGGTFGLSLALARGENPHVAAAAAAPAPACAIPAVVLLESHRVNQRVVVKGLARATFAGRQATVEALVKSKRLGRAVTAKVGPDGKFSASLALPARSKRASARYRATIGTKRSVELRLVRRMIVASRKSTAGGIRVSGVIGGVPRRWELEIRRVRCVGRDRVTTKHTTPKGRFSLVFPKPAVTDPVTLYRSKAVFGGKKTFTEILLAIVPPIKHPLLARDDTASTDEDVALAIDAVSLLANDADPNGGTLSITAVRPRADTHGTVTLARGTVTYKPAQDFHGRAGFDYSLSDANGNVASARVVVDVRAVQDPPSAADDRATTALNVPLGIVASQLLANDSDPDGDALSVTQVGGDAGTHGIVAMANGTVTYAPARGFAGDAPFAYTISDGHGNTDNATVNVTVQPGHDPPVARDDSAATREDQPLAVAVAELLANDSDPDDDQLSVAGVSGGPATHGTVSLADGRVTYTPTADFNGAAAFKYTLSDGHGGAAEATVTIGVREVNDPPTAGADAKSPLGRAISFPSADLAANDSAGPTNESSQSLTVKQVTPSTATHGDVTLTLGTVVYTAIPGFTGDATFGYEVCDDGTTAGDPDPRCAEGQVTVGVGQGPAPAADDLSIATDEDDPAAMALSATAASGEPLTYAIVAAPQHGSVSPSTAGPAARTYTPDADFNGSDHFTYKANDGSRDSNTATVTVTVRPMQDPPTARPDAASADENISLAIDAADLLANDSDTDHDELTVTSVATTAQTRGAVALTAGRIVFTPRRGFTGDDEFEYRISDGHGGSATAKVDVKVDPASGAPGCTDHAGGIFVTGHDPDAHATAGPNRDGAKNILKRAVAFVTSGNAAPRVLLVTGRSVVGAHEYDPLDGLVAAGLDPDVADAGGLSPISLSSVDFSDYDAVVVASADGGWLTQREVDLLVARRSALHAFVNAGGGLVALSESDASVNLMTPGRYAFLPFVVAGSGLTQSGGGTLTPFGVSLGLTSADVNSNAAHAAFDATPGLEIVETGDWGRNISLAARGRCVGDAGLQPRVLIGDATVTEGNDGTRELSVRARLSKGYGRPVSLQFTTSDGSAAAGSDYEPTAGTLAFAPGTTAATIRVPIFGDRDPEPDESIELMLSAPVEATLERAAATITILDDDDYDPAAPGCTDEPGGIFLTGHDADFHAIYSPSAQKILQRAVAFVTRDRPDPRMLLVTGLIDAGVHHSDPRGGLTAAGLTFDVADADGGTPTPLASVDFEDYDVVVVASDDSGWLRQQELDLLIARRQSLQAFVNRGGGLVALAEGNDVTGLTTQDRFGFLPFVPGIVGFAQVEHEFTVTPLGAEMGLTDEDVSDDAAHMYFLPGSPLQVVDRDGELRPISLAARGRCIGDVGVRPAISIADVSVAEGNDGEHDATVTATLTNPYPAPVSATFATSDATASAPGDYRASSGTVTFAPGQTSATISVSIVADAKRESDETLHVGLSGPVQATLDRSDAIVTILDDDDVAPGCTDHPGAIFLTGHDPDAHPGSTGARAILQRAVAFVAPNRPDPRMLLVTGLVDPGLPHSDPRDGLSAAGFTFDVADADGLTSTSLASVDFEDYDVVMVASDAAGWLRQQELDVLVGRRESLQAFVNRGGGLVALAEGGEDALTSRDRYAFLPFVLGTSGPSPSAPWLTVTPFGSVMGLTDADVSDNPARVAFLPGSTLDVVDRDADLRPVSLAARGSCVGDGGVQPDLSIADARVTEGDDGEHDAFVTATLDHPYPWPVTARVTTSDISASAATPENTATVLDERFDSTRCVEATTRLKQFNVLDGNVHIAGPECGVEYPGDHGYALDMDGRGGHSTIETKRVFAAGVYDLTFALAGHTARSSSTTVSFGSYSRSIAKAREEPFAVYEQRNIYLSEPAPLRFAVDPGSEAGPTLDDVRVKLAAPASDYRAVTATVTVPAGETSATVGMPIIGDTRLEDDETFGVSLSSPTNATLGDAGSVVTIANDDERPPSLAVADASVIEGDDNEHDVAVTATLSNPSSKPVTASFATSDITAKATGGEPPPEVVFEDSFTDEPCGQRTTLRQFLVLVNNVNVFDDQCGGWGMNGDHGRAVDLDGWETSSTIETMQTFEPGVYDLRFDLAGHLIRPSSVIVDLGPFSRRYDKTSRDVGQFKRYEIRRIELTTPSKLRFTVPPSGGLRAGATLDDVRVVRHQPRGDYRSVARTITIPPGDTTATIGVPILGDTEVEGDETFRVALSTPVNATLGDGDSTVTIEDDDPNTPPTARDDEGSIAEEDNTLLIGVDPLLANDSDPDGDSLRIVDVQATADTHGSVMVDAGPVVYNPAADYFGPASFEYTIDDDRGGRATATAHLTVTDYNDRPVANPDAKRNAGPTLSFPVSDLLVNDLPGPANEGGQSLTVTKVMPTSATHGEVALVLGTVTYLPEPGFNGKATFGYEVCDDGTTLGVPSPRCNDAGTVSVTRPYVPARTPTLLGVRASHRGGQAYLDLEVVVDVPGPDGPRSETIVPFQASGYGYQLAAPGGAQGFQARDFDDSSFDERDAAFGDSTDCRSDVRTEWPRGNDLLLRRYLDLPSGATNLRVKIASDNEIQVVYLNGIDISHGGVPGTVCGDHDTVVVTAPDEILFDDDVSSAPVASDVAVTTDEDEGKDITMSATSPSGAALTYTILDPPDQGTLSPPGPGVAKRAYTPNVNANGTDSFTYVASDGTETSAPATVTITIRSINDPPVIVTDKKSTERDAPLTFATGDLLANDEPGPDNEDAQSLSVASVTAGEDTHGTVVLAGGEITFTPAAGYLGNASFEYHACDNGQTAGDPEPRCADATVQVKVAVPAPTHLSITPDSRTIAGGETVDYAATGTFADGSSRDVTDDVTWTSLVPAAANVTPAGVARGGLPGSTTITAKEGDVTATVSLTVTSAVLRSIVVEPASPTLLVGDAQPLDATGVLSDGTSQSLNGLVGWTSSNDAVASVSPAGTATPIAEGTTNITATRDGITGSATITVNARADADETEPIAEITAPDDGAEVTEPTDIVGTASDPNFLKYTLQIAPAGETSFTTIEESTDPVTDGTLGRLDPTMLLNDIYKVLLTVYDAGGNTTTAITTVQVARDMKVGNFSLAFKDLEVPMAGIPIGVNRVYDSRDKSVGDFGVGWRLDVQTMRIRANRVQGSTWQVSQIDFLHVALIPNGEHKVSLTLPDGHVEEFDLVPSPSVGVGAIKEVTAHYDARPRTLGELQTLDNPGLVVVGDQPGAVSLLDNADFSTVFDPQTFAYTAADGTVYVIDKSTGVRSVTDLNGNTLTFGPDGIIHSSGESVDFIRDAKGRITKITDPMGHEQRYAYDANGDLASRTDPSGHRTTFAYNRSHGLIEIRDPRGYQAARNEYDDDGRLVAIVGADGHRTTYEHDLAGRREVTRDRRGKATVYVYDADGNILEQTDALGHTVTRTYDARGNELTMTDQRGNTTTTRYDDRNNVEWQRDPGGAIVTSTYSRRNQLESRTDGRDHTTTYRYDANSNVLSVTDPREGVVTHRYDVRGQRMSTTDAMGDVTLFEYDDAGRVVRQVDPADAVTTYTYDANGNRRSQTQRRTDASGATIDVVSQTTYDAENRPLERTDGNGNVTSTAYDPTGRVAATVDGEGGRTSMAYDAVGRLASTTFADGTTEENSYDAEGNRVATTDQAGRVTRLGYDALNRVERIDGPDGATSTADYDATGQLAALIDARGNRSTLEYDANGRLSRITDARGAVTQFAYDANGNKIREIDPRGHTTSFDYNPSDQLTSTTFPDATTQSTIYDPVGRPVGKIDEAGVQTTFGYDPAGRMNAVLDALNETTTYAHDEMGNLTKITDARGNATRFSSDNVGNMVKRTLPLGESETFAYDANTNLISHTDFSGVSTVKRYDDMNRLTREERPEGPTIRRYTPTGQQSVVEDPSGQTRYEYDEMDRIVQVTDPDGAVVRYGYDADGNRSSLESAAGRIGYTRDAVGNLIDVTHPDGGITHYGYDLARNQVSATLPNTTHEERTYDDRNRLVGIRQQRVDASLIGEYTYTLSPTGQRTAVDEHGGRLVSYGYDDLSRLVSEDVTSPTAPDTHTTYTYDAVGNRLTDATDTATTNYTYDANDRLLARGDTTYHYDTDGNLVRRDDPSAIQTFTYDSMNHLRGTTAGDTTTQFRYDAAGNRVASTTGANTTRFVLDTAGPLSRVLEEHSSDGSPDASYVFGNEFVSQTQGSETSYYHHDGAGSTRALTDAGANMRDTYDYDAFGNETGSTGSTTNDIRYVGEQLEPQLGTYNLRARHYDPSTGRFVSLDPLRIANLQQPASLHKYGYTAGDPVNRTDPTGLEFDLIGLNVGISIVAVAVQMTVVRLQLIPRAAALVAAAALLTVYKQHTALSCGDKERIGAQWAFRTGLAAILITYAIRDKTISKAVYAYLAAATVGEYNKQGELCPKP